MLFICKYSVLIKTRQISVKSLRDTISQKCVYILYKPETVVHIARDFKSIFSVKTQSVKYKESKTRILNDF